MNSNHLPQYKKVNINLEFFSFFQGTLTQRPSAQPLSIGSDDPICDDLNDLASTPCGPATSNESGEPMNKDLTNPSAEHANKRRRTNRFEKIAQTLADFSDDDQEETESNVNELLETLRKHLNNKRKCVGSIDQIEQAEIIHLPIGPHTPPSPPPLHRTPSPPLPVSVENPLSHNEHPTLPQQTDPEHMELVDA